jgi:hypothetical protein
MGRLIDLQGTILALADTVFQELMALGSPEPLKETFIEETSASLASWRKWSENLMALFSNEDPCQSLLKQAVGWHNMCHFHTSDLRLPESCHISLNRYLP